MKRRQFIKVAGLTGLASYAATEQLFAETLTANSYVPGKEKGMVFLFQGDSITDGNWGGCGQTRSVVDGNHILGHGYVFAIAARLGADFPEASLIFHNRGYSGHKITDLESRWERDTLALNPDVLSVLIGVNDAFAAALNQNDATCCAVFEQKYRSLLQQCREAKPETLFVLGVPFYYPVAGNYYEYHEAWTKDLLPRAEVVRSLAREFDAVLLDYPRMFDKAVKRAPIEYWTWDGVHPSVAGHELMAREWVGQAGKKLKFLKK